MMFSDIDDDDDNVEVKNLVPATSCRSVTATAATVLIIWSKECKSSGVVSHFVLFN